MKITHSYETHYYCSRCRKYYKKETVSGCRCPVHGYKLRTKPRLGISRQRRRRLREGKI